MNKKFPHQNKKRLDSEERRSLLPPDEILDLVGVKEGDIFLDIGAGTGYFTLPASIKVGREGKVIALDISKEMLASLQEKLQKGNYKNIELKLSGENSFPLTDSSVTFAFLAFVFHEVDNPSLFLAEIKRVLKPQGKLAIIEWKKKESTFGPPLDHRLSDEKIQSHLLEASFKIEKTHNYKDDFVIFVGYKNRLL